ncbi:hypothetical protein P8452_10030 [Trifolium repens]|nr:hypothetical protein P8452_10030 [Trifolium repens]
MDDYLMQSYENAKNKIFWDLENASIPKQVRKDKCNSSQILSRFKSALSSAKMNGPISMEVFSQTDTIPIGFVDTLTASAKSVRVTLVPPRFIRVRNEEERQKEVVDAAITNSVTHYMRKGFKNLPRNVILVTGDQDFTKLIAQLKRHGFNIIVVLTDQSLNTGAFLGQHADMIWTFDDFRKGMEPIFKKQTQVERSERQAFVGSVSKLMGIVDSLHEERIACSEQNLKLLLMEDDFKKILKLAVTLGKIVEEKEEGVLNKLKQGASLSLDEILANQLANRNEELTRFYRLAYTHSSTLNVFTTPRVNDFPRKLWEEVGHAILNNATLQIELKQSKNLYLAASALRKHCNYIKDYYLSHIVSLIRIMFGELGWLTYLFAIRDVRISFIDAFFKSLERKRKRKPSAMAFPKVSRTPNFKQLDNKNKTFICWDFDSTPAPPDQAIFKYIPEKMVCAVRNCKLEGPVTIKVFAKTEVFNPFRKVLSRADIEVTDIKFKQGRQNAVSSKIPHDVGLLSVGDLSIANYIFITDNEFYAEVMRRLKKEGHKIILVQSEMIVAELIEIADDETIAADERSTITMMIAQVMNVTHALCNNKSLPTRANIRKECPEGRIQRQRYVGLVELRMKMIK